MAIAEKAEKGAAFVRQIKVCLYNEKEYCLQASFSPPRYKRNDLDNRNDSQNKRSEITFAAALEPSHHFSSAYSTHCLQDQPIKMSTPLTNVVLIGVSFSK